MNNPTHYTLCRFHTDPRGNRCAFGQQCEYMHYHELHRPNIQELTLSALLTLNYFLSLLLAQQQPQNLHHQSQVQLNANAAPYIPLSEPIGGKHFENYIECKVDIGDTTSEFLDDKIEIPSMDSVLGLESNEQDEKSDDLKDGDDSKADGNAKETPVDKLTVPTLPSCKQKLKEQWRYILANDPVPALQLYPELEKMLDSTQLIGDTDGILRGLKTEKWNGHPIIIRDLIKSKKRYSVVPFDYNINHKPMLIKEENIGRMETFPATHAYYKFKHDVHAESWDILTVGGECHGNDSILTYFVLHQLPIWDATMKRYTSPRIEKFNEAYKALVLDTVRESKSKDLKVTLTDCPKIISFLYSLSFSRKLHIVRIFEISHKWQMQKWNDKSDLYVPLP